MDVVLAGGLEALGKDHIRQSTWGLGRLFRSVAWAAGPRYSTSPTSRVRATWFTFQLMLKLPLPPVIRS